MAGGACPFCANSGHDRHCVAYLNLGENRTFTWDRHLDVVLDQGERVVVPTQRVRPKGNLSDDSLGAPHPGVFENEVGIFVLLAQQTLIKFAFALAIDRRFHA